MSMDSTLCGLPDNVLIYTIAFLSVTDVLLLRQRSKRFSALTGLHVVWLNSFKLNIASNDYPFSLDNTELEHRTRHTTFIGLSIYEIKFIPGRQHKWVLTVSKGIWSVLTIWDFARGHKYSEWSPKGVIFTRAKLNADPESEAGVAVSLSQRVVLLHLNDNGFLHIIHSFDTDLRPVGFSGYIIALDDDTSKTVIYNWKTEERASLDDVSDAQHVHCLQVVFTPSTILVLRARSITHYDSTFSRVTTHSFGQVDGTSVTPTTILIRSRSDNPWGSEPNSLELYSLSCLPPTLIDKSAKYQPNADLFDAPILSSASPLYRSIRATLP
ncbi:hypothetical protein ARMGADRAFT_1169299 [Armillaria gallica]|uniref:F-box domain-containing protein n=1 Tax=Armillaria gallica TaxID=47427 RepID=A0A2H3DD31_ARMGA|nr:hypothetical protein ARMGADRAFT_1169299 [Armillaria gallica]